MDPLKEDDLVRIVKLWPAQRTKNAADRAFAKKAVCGVLASGHGFRYNAFRFAQFGRKNDWSGMDHRERRTEIMTWSSSCKGFFRRLLRMGGILLAGIAAGFGLLTAVFLLPVGSMEQHVLESLPALNGEWGTGEESYEQVVKGYPSTQLDNSTDAYMLLTAIHRSEKSAVDQAIQLYSWQEEGANQYISLLRFGENGSEGMREVAIARYWLGFLVVLKPLLLYMNYMDIRMVNMIVQMALLMCICRLMQKRGVGRYVLPFGLSMLCITPGITWLSLQFSTTLLVAQAAMAVLLWKPHLMEKRMGEDVFFLLVGMATSYFDFLTYPVASLGMPLIVWLLLHRNETARSRLVRMVHCGLCWAFGYAGMWAGKWALALLYGSEGFWSTLVGSLETRTSQKIRDVGEISRLDALWKAFSVFLKKPYLIAGVVVSLGYGLLFIRRKARRLSAVEKPDLAGTMLGVALLPLAWYLFAANHTYNHAFFTSRALCVTAFAMGSALIAWLPTEKERKN